MHRERLHTNTKGRLISFGVSHGALLTGTDSNLQLWCPLPSPSSQIQSTEQSALGVYTFSFPEKELLGDIPRKKGSLEVRGNNGKAQIPRSEQSLFPSI